MVGLADDRGESGASGGPVPRATRTERLVEVLVFLFLIVPSMILSLFAVTQGGLSFVLVALSSIFQDLALVALILFFLWRDRQPVSTIGWTARNAWGEAALGIGLFIPVFFGASLLESFLQSIGLSVPSTPPSFLAPQGTGELILGFVLVVVVAISEETIFRGYLILRFGELTLSVAAAVLLSTLVFSLGHAYEGSAGLVTVGVIGLVFALVYVWRGSLVAPVVMHFLLDLVSIVLAPLFS